MSQSDQIDLLAAALVEFQKNAPAVVKNSVNPHFKNRYADLTAVIDATRQPLADSGLAIVQLPDGDDLITRLIHKSGQWIASRTPVKSVKPDAQGYGSGLSYSRRYSYLAMLSLAAEDDDAQAAVASRPSKKAAPTPAPVDIPPRRATVHKMSPFLTEAETRKKLAEMFTAGAVHYVLDWAASPERKSPTPADKFTAAHFESLEKNRKTVEQYIEEKLFAAKSDKNHIDDGDLWVEEGSI